MDLPPVTVGLPVAAAHVGDVIKVPEFRRGRPSSQPALSQLVTPPTTPNIQLDYPGEALRQHHEGDVTVRLTIGIDGRAHQCEVTAGTGYSELDAGTCERLVRYAVYRPALGANGQPIESSLTMTIKWRIPEK